MPILLLKFYIIHIAFNFGSTLCQLDENIEIKSLTAEPSYKSVSLTWFVGNYKNATIRKNNDFYVHYCELQTWGSHRCKTKTIKDNTDYDNNKQKQYSTVVDNLKMATKYLFHVESAKLDQQKAIPRVDFGGNELNSDLLGEKVIVPTKGFSAQATKCLQHVSEIEIQTGPFFGGIIMSENNENCQIQGNPLSDQHVYVIRIDHEKCGSQVDHAQVTTSITVQENVGIFTHSTRRFAVMCSYQPDTLTVRTSFSIPSRSTLQSPKNTTDRESRKRIFRIVGKEALLLTTETSQSPPLASLNETELNNFSNERIDSTPDTLGFNGDVSVIVQRNENIQELNATFDRLTYESKLQKSEKSATSSVFIVLGFTMLSIIIFTAFVFLVGRKLRKWPLVKF